MPGAQNANETAVYENSIAVFVTATHRILPLMMIEKNSSPLHRNGNVENTEREQAMNQRWCEFDVRVFDPEKPRESVQHVLSRLKPVLQGGDSGGIMLCCGWLADLALVFSGDLNQELPWSSSRLKHWQGHTYRDLAALIHAIREESENQSLPWLNIGWLVVGHGRFVFPPEHDLYDFEGVFLERHPEVYQPPKGSPYDGRHTRTWALLDADDHGYAAFPDGIPEGLTWVEFFSRQWAAMAKAVGFSAIMLRDGLPGVPDVPEGQIPTDRDKTQNAAHLIRLVKSAYPQAKVLGYSGPSGSSSRKGYDLSFIAAEGYLDLWITQSWGGAWQDWWNSQRAGWSFQVASILADRAAIRKPEHARCRHLHLIETFDAFEPWDIIHGHRGKLAWAIMAFSHAATYGKDGQARGADGTYVSWLTDRHGNLLSEEDCLWLGRELDQADQSLRTLEETHGAIWLQNREAVVALPPEVEQGEAGELMQDHLGWMLKWGLPLAGITYQAAHVPHADGLILGIETEDPAVSPLMAIGRCDKIREQVREACGVEVTNDWIKGGFLALEGEEVRPAALTNLPRRPAVRSDDILLQADGSPMMTCGPRGIWWQPPLRHSDVTLIMPNILGSFEPYRRAARELTHRMNGPVIENPPLHGPVTFTAWTSDGKLHLLLGNLESGHTGDARHPRSVTLRQLPPDISLEDIDSGDTLQADNAGKLTVTVGPESRLLLRERKVSPSAAAVQT